MKKLVYIIPLFVCLFTYIPLRSQDTLHINYYGNAPFTKEENGKLSGIEIDIVNEYILWLKTTKKMNVVPKYTGFTSFGDFYASVKKGNAHTIGMGGVTVLPERAKEVDFLSSYLKNVTFCITNGNAPDIKTKTAPEIIKTLGSMTGLTIPGTSLDRYVNEIKSLYVKDLKIKTFANQSAILDEIAKNTLAFGYIEAIEFWFYLKNHPQRFLKMQRAMSLSKEELAFITPKGGIHKAHFKEFFTKFKTTRNYRAILEKYVGSYMTQNMAIN